VRPGLPAYPENMTSLPSDDQPGGPEPGWLADHTRFFQLRDGTAILIRPIVPSDKERLQQGLAMMSPESRYLRFLHYFERLTPSELRYLTEIDYHDHFALLAMLVDDPSHPGLGVARFIRDPNRPQEAEAAVAVIDSYQRRGIGTLLLTRLAEVARTCGISRFIAYMTPEHPAVAHLLERVEAEVTQSEGLLRVAVPIEADGPGAANRAILRAAAGYQLPVVPGSARWSTR
jgi:GNAT superfamily N-acetyltransferase